MYAASLICFLADPVICCNAPAEDYSFDLAATGDSYQHSSYYYDWDRNGKTVNPFTETPDYTEL